ncbi:hypothetical protein DFH08DRAFT_1039683 [Mycena albidolilacea]|uniref:Uncharacterized protein n=1 Tax=Mycena albidolilacea TaxID=1033008 RepID=A0AAD7EEJ9_9AGAR|nr:hypothetical protein DFH08DRAFT_1039683 [Mycena albidolilacea]
MEERGQGGIEGIRREAKAALLDERDAGRIRGVEARQTRSGGGIVVNGEGQLQNCDVGKRGRRDTGTKKRVTWTWQRRGNGVDSVNAEAGHPAEERTTGAEAGGGSGDVVADSVRTACGGRRLRSDSGGAAMGGNSKTGNSKTAATALSSEAERNGHGRGPGAEGAGVGQRGRVRLRENGKQVVDTPIPAWSQISTWSERCGEVAGRLFAEWKTFGMSVKGIYQTGECWRRRVDYWVLGNTIARKRRYKAEKECNAQQLWEHAVWPASTCLAAT